MSDHENEIIRKLRRIIEKKDQKITMLDGRLDGEDRPRHADENADGLKNLEKSQLIHGCEMFDGIITDEKSLTPNHVGL